MGRDMRREIWKRRRALGSLIGLLAVAVSISVAARPGAAQQDAVAFETDELAIVTAGGATHRFTVELARTPQQQAHGLMFRENLAPDRGMLFLHERAHIASMWMKNTYIPLDMLFIAGDGRIVKIAERTVPRSRQGISSGQPVKAVLELRGGTADRLGLAPGDRVRYPAFDGEA